MPQIVKLTGNVSVGTGQALPHNLIRTPNVHVLGVGTSANVVKHTTAHDTTNAYYTNSAGSPQAVVGLLMALHSFESNRVSMLEGTSSGAGALVLPHGLVAAPDLIFVAFGTNANIASGSITSDATNVTINPTAGSQSYSLMVAAFHSTWGTKQWGLLRSGVNGITTVAGSATNAPVIHGLNRAPGFVVLGARCGANITLGTTSPDATNIYVNNSAGGAQSLEALVIAGHSIIS